MSARMLRRGKFRALLVEMQISAATVEIVWRFHTQKFKKWNCFMTQWFHFWAYIQRNPKHLFKRIYSFLCSLQCYLQQPSYGSNPSVHQQRYIYTKEYYLVIKKNEIIPITTTWIDLERIVLNKINYTEKITYYFIFIYNLKTK